MENKIFPSRLEELWEKAMTTSDDKERTNLLCAAGEKSQLGVFLRRSGRTWLDNLVLPVSCLPYSLTPCSSSLFLSPLSSFSPSLLPFFRLFFLPCCPLSASICTADTLRTVHFAEFWGQGHSEGHSHSTDALVRTDWSEIQKWKKIAQGIECRQLSWVTKEKQSVHFLPSPWKMETA